MPILSSKQTAEQKSGKSGGPLSSKMTSEQMALDAANKKLSAEQAAEAKFQKEMDASLQEMIDNAKILDKEEQKEIKDAGGLILKAFGVSAFKDLKLTAKEFYEHIDNEVSKADHDKIIKAMQDLGKKHAGTNDDAAGEIATLKLLLGIDVVDKKALDGIKAAVEQESIKDFYESTFNVKAGWIFNAGPSYVSKNDLLKFMVKEIKASNATQNTEIDDIESFIAVKVAGDIAKYHGGDLEGAAEVAMAHVNDIDTFLAANPNVDISHH